MIDEEYMDLIENSQKQWANCKKLTKEREEFGDGTPYTFVVHKKWCKSENFGVNHINSMPIDYKISEKGLKEC